MSSREYTKSGIPSCRSIGVVCGDTMTAGALHVAQGVRLGSSISITVATKVEFLVRVFRPDRAFQKKMLFEHGQILSDVVKQLMETYELCPEACYFHMNHVRVDEDDLESEMGDWPDYVRHRCPLLSITGCTNRELEGEVDVARLKENSHKRSFDMLAQQQRVAEREAEILQAQHRAVVQSHQKALDTAEANHRRIAKRLRTEAVARDVVLGRAEYLLDKSAAIRAHYEEAQAKVDAREREAGALPVQPGPAPAAIVAVDECCVCLQPIGQQCVVVPCGHRCVGVCCKEKVNLLGKCPLCRGDVMMVVALF